MYKYIDTVVFKHVHNIIYGTKKIKLLRYSNYLSLHFPLICLYLPMYNSLKIMSVHLMAKNYSYMLTSSMPSTYIRGKLGCGLFPSTTKNPWLVDTWHASYGFILQSVSYTPYMDYYLINELSHAFLWKKL